MRNKSYSPLFFSCCHEKSSRRLLTVSNPPPFKKCALHSPPPPLSLSARSCEVVGLYSSIGASSYGISIHVTIPFPRVMFPYSHCAFSPLFGFLFCRFPCQVLEMRGDAFAHFGNAAVVQTIVEKLPDIAREVAAPPSRTKKVRGCPCFVFNLLLLLFV